MFLFCLSIVCIICFLCDIFFALKQNVSHISTKIVKKIKKMLAFNENVIYKPYS